MGNIYEHCSILLGLTAIGLTGAILGTGLNGKFATPPESSSNVLSYNDTQVGYCEEYCEKFSAVCANQGFPVENCMEECVKFPKTAPPVYNLTFDPVDLGSDTLACRATHLSFAIEFGGGGDPVAASRSPDAAFHCGHASAGGEGICTDYPGNDVDGAPNPFQIMQAGGRLSYGSCFVTRDRTVADCMRSNLNDATVNDALAVLPSTVEHVFLHVNNLNRVPANLGTLFPSLKSIYLDGNNITSVSASDFSNMAGLEILSLNVNPITVLPGNLLSGVPNLKTFSLFLPSGYGSSLSTIPSNFFQNTRGIVNIIMYGHKGLTSFERGVFDYLADCEIISFVDCSFTFQGFPDGVFDDLVSLKYFDFFINDFSGRIPSDLFGVWARNVFRIVLWGNGNLNGIGAGAFDNLVNAKKLFLHGTGITADDIARVEVPSSVEVLTL